MRVCAALTSGNHELYHNSTVNNLAAVSPTNCQFDGIASVFCADVSYSCGNPERVRRLLGRALPDSQHLQRYHWRAGNSFPDVLPLSPRLSHSAITNDGSEQQNINPRVLNSGDLGQVGSPYTIVTGKMGKKLLVMGFLYNMQNSCEVPSFHAN